MKVIITNQLFLFMNQYLFLHLLQDEIYLQCRTAGGLLVTMTEKAVEQRSKALVCVYGYFTQSGALKGFERKRTSPYISFFSSFPAKAHCTEVSAQSPNHVIPKKVIISFTASQFHTPKKHTKNTKTSGISPFFFSHG